jgi:hypothetical protein
MIPWVRRYAFQLGPHDETLVTQGGKSGSVKFRGLAIPRSMSFACIPRVAPT